MHLTILLFKELDHFPTFFTITNNVPVTLWTKLVSLCACVQVFVINLIKGKF